MEFESIDDLKKVTINRYEAVIVAARHARHLNAKRLAEIEKLEEEPTEVDIEARKMTSVALRDLMDGKVIFERSDTE